MLPRFFSRARKKLRYMYRNPIESDVMQKANLSKMGKWDEKDIFLVTYPKSGTTWMQNMIAMMSFDLNLINTPYALVRDLVPTVYWPFYRRYMTPTFFKSHQFPDKRYRRVVYVIRDGRDAIVSYYHYAKGVGKAQKSIADFVKDGISEEMMTSPYWHEHVEAWMQNPFNAEMLIIRYEDLHADTVKELKRFCEFAGFERDDDYLTQVAAASTFGKMQDREKKFGIGRSWQDSNNTFVRRGEMGSYKDEMPAEAIAAFNAMSAETLKRFGYSVE
jgi:hypothetical protein